MRGYRLILPILLGVVSLTISPTSLAGWHATKWGIVHAEVSINADGKVTNVVLLEDKLSNAVKSTIVDSVKKWQFEPVLSDGVAVPSLTYVNFNVCAIPSGDGYDLAVHYVDNGPLFDRANELEFTPAIDYYSNDHQSIKVQLTVEPDGNASLDDVVMVDVAPMIQRDIRNAVKSWVKSMRFKPERIGGHPVATKLEWPFDLVRVPIGAHTDDVDTTTDPACKSARAAGQSPHAVNDPIKRRVDSVSSDPKAPAK